MATPIFRFPVNYIGISRGFTSAHPALDLGWNANYGGQNAPIYAPADGTVVAVVNDKNNDTSVVSWGNYVKINHGGGWHTLNAHMLRGSVRVVVGQAVKQGDIIGNINNSGYSFGSHDHYELYKGGSSSVYRVDPLLYTYAYPDQVVSVATEEHYGILYYEPATNYVGTPVARNTAVPQINIQTDYLRGRLAPDISAQVLGFVNKGIYNVLRQQNSGDYVFHEIENNLWCAYFPDSQTLYPAQTPNDLPAGMVYRSYDSAYASFSLEGALAFQATQDPRSKLRLSPDERYRVYIPGQTTTSTATALSIVGPDNLVLIEQV